MNGQPLTDQNDRLGPLAGKVIGVAGALGVLGLASSLLIGVVNGQWNRFWRSYLVAFVFVVSLALGALFFTLLQHMTKAGWSVVLRRLSEAIATNLSWLWIAFVPIVVLVLTGKGQVLYHWADPNVFVPGSPQFEPVISKKYIFFNPTFWSLRTAFYFIVWGVATRMFFRKSVEQDSTGDVKLTSQMQGIAPLFMVLFALTQTFALIDWVMSLEPDWFSTIFGVYFFAACLCGFFSALIISIWFLQRSGRITSAITREHYQDAGKLLFGFGVVFWAYIAYSQYMLIWYANIPEETSWYITRQIGSWRNISLILLVGHFAVPFLLLVSKHPKRIKSVLALVAVWMMLMHYVDLYWLIMPRIPSDLMTKAETYNQLALAATKSGNDLGFHPHLLDLTCLVGLGGLAVAWTTHRLRSCCLIPKQDPRLSESLTFENT